MPGHAVADKVSRIKNDDYRLLVHTWESACDAEHLLLTGYKQK